MPDHPSWPAELVEKARRKLDESFPRGGEFSADSWSTVARIVLSALSGDLVPREEAAPFLGDDAHPDWTDYVATNLLATLQRAPDTGDWHGALRAWCERNTTGRMQPNTVWPRSVDDEVEVPWAVPGSDTPGIELVPRSQADALAGALAQVATIAPGGTRWPRFTLPAHHRIYALVRFQDETVFAGGEDVEAARIALRDELLRLASYRSSSSKGESPA